MTSHPLTTRSNGHDTTHTAIGSAEAECPYCGQPISRKEFKEITAKIADEERARVATVEAELKARFARETAKAEAIKKIEVEAAKRNAAKAAEAQIKALRTNQETVIATRLAAQRATLEKATATAVLAERAKYVTEKLALEGQLEDLKRRVQARTANQLGEPGEVDLYERLSAAFPDDRVSRVVKGVPGCDVLIEIIHNGDVIGKIALDSKVHARWQNKFTSKLRSDMLAEGADFAILSTSVFPKDTAQLHIQDGVIVADPARVPVLVHLLRSQIIDNHTLKLTAEARDAKAERLLAYVVSPGCRDLLDKIVRLTTDMANLDLKEADVHATTWKKRGDLIRGIQTVHAEFAAAVSAIIAGDR
jgi:hypothetical protein